MSILIMPVVDIAGRSHYEGDSSSIDISNHLSVQKGNNLYVNEMGDKMRGPLDMNYNNITNVAEPLEDNDAVNRIYLTKTKQILEEKLQDEAKTLYEEAKKLREEVIKLKGEIKLAMNKLESGLQNEIKAITDRIVKLEKIEAPWVYGYIIDIGGSEEKNKLIIRKIHIPILRELANLLNLPAIQKSQCKLQISAILDDDKYQDDIFINIQKYEIDIDSITVYVNITRPSTRGWGLLLQAHLSITIFKNKMEIL